MPENGNGFRKLSDALKRAAEEKDKEFKGLGEQQPVVPSPALPKPEPEAPPRKPEMAALSAGISKKIVAYHQPNSQVAEQFRVMKTHACASDKGYKVKAIEVTSPSNGEGKSVTAVNLAVVMAQDFAKPVILIDCNMRKPAVDSLLGIRSGKGLSDVLSGRAGLQDALVASDVPNLTVLPAGETAVNPNELLGSEKMKAVLSELKAKYEAVILDAPAIIPFADPRILSKVVDGVIIVVRSGKTRREVAARAESVLNNVGANIMGYVLTGIEYHIPEYIHRHL